MIEKGAIVRDSIIMQNAVIKEGAVIDKAIIAEQAVIGERAQLGVGEEVPNKVKPADLCIWTDSDWREGGCSAGCKDRKEYRCHRHYDSGGLSGWSARKR